MNISEIKTYNNDKLMLDVNNAYTNYLIRNLPKAKTDTKTNKPETKYDIKEGTAKTNKAVNDATNAYHKWLISQAPKKEDLTNRIYKGLNNITKGTYYDNKGHILFLNGQLTGLGKEVFGKDSNRAEWNMRNGNIFQNNIWRADTDTFDFKTGKAKKGYEGRFKKGDNGRWLFLDSKDNKWTFFNSDSKNVSSNNINKLKKSNIQEPATSARTKWDIGKDFGNFYWTESLKLAYRTAWLKANPNTRLHINEDIAAMLKLHNPNWVAPYDTQYDNDFEKDFNLYVNKYYAKNSNNSLFTNAWLAKSNSKFKNTIWNGNEAYIPAANNFKVLSDGNIYNITSGTKYYGPSMGDSRKMVNLNGKVYILINKNGGKLINTNGRFEKWINS